MNGRKCFLALVLATVANLSYAEIFAGFDSFCGLPVIIGDDPQIASARTDQNGNQLIHIDPAAAANVNTSAMFVLAHECAHHQLGHTSGLGQLARYSGGTRAQELEADCWAARALREAGQDFDITRTVIDDAMRGATPAGNYPTGEQRAQNILACLVSQPLSQQDCRVEIEPCAHVAHPNGDKVPCQHLVPAHAGGDVIPCQHTCMTPFGPRPCHLGGDIVQCQHIVKMHTFDIIPCQHVAHPSGHQRQICE